MKMKIVVLLMIILAGMDSFAQSGLIPDNITKEAMEKINFLTGKWSGNGWILMGKEKHQFSQTESVIQKVNNAVFVIDGLGIDSKTNNVVHQAFAVVSYDKANRKYLMRGFRADGNFIDAEANLDENGSFIWGYTHPQAGQMKYTIKLKDGKWLETGEICRDGKTWYQFFETSLVKQ